MSWNGFSRNLTKKLIDVFTARAEINNDNTQTDLNADRSDNIPPEKLPTIWMRLPFIGKHGNILTKKFIKKTRRLLKGPCKLILLLLSLIPTNYQKNGTKGYKLN